MTAKIWKVSGSGRQVRVSLSFAAHGKLIVPRQRLLARKSSRPSLPYQVRPGAARVRIRADCSSFESALYVVDLKRFREVRNVFGELEEVVI